MTLDEIRTQWAGLREDERVAAFAALPLDQLRSIYPKLTRAERHAALPKWFPGYFDPSEPTWDDVCDEEVEGLATGHLIAGEMAKFEREEMAANKRRSGIDWLAHGDAIQQLMEAARAIYFPCYKDWLAQNAEEGSRWRPHRSLRQNDPVGPQHDYSAIITQSNSDAIWKRAWQCVGLDGPPPWGSFFEAEHEKPVDGATGRRPPKDGVMAHGLGIFRDRPIGTTPMLPVFELVRRFYLDTLGGRAFNPDFVFTDEVAEERPTPDGGREHHYVLPRGAAIAARVERTKLNPAAKFLSLIVKEVDSQFGERQTRLVARAYRRRRKL